MESTGWSYYSGGGYQVYAGIYGFVVCGATCDQPVMGPMDWGSQYPLSSGTPLAACTGSVGVIWLLVIGSSVCTVVALYRARFRATEDSTYLKVTAMVISIVAITTNLMALTNYGSACMQKINPANGDDADEMKIGTGFILFLVALVFCHIPSLLINILLPVPGPDSDVWNEKVKPNQMELAVGKLALEASSEAEAASLQANEALIELRLAEAWQWGHPQWPDGCIRLPDGTWQIPEIGLPDGWEMTLDGNLKMPDGSFQMPDGSFQMPDGNFRWPNGCITLSDGTWQIPEIDLPDGWEMTLDGSLKLPDGSFQMPDGSFQMPGGNFRTQESAPDVEAARAKYEATYQLDLQWKLVFSGPGGFDLSQLEHLKVEGFKIELDMSKFEKLKIQGFQFDTSNLPDMSYLKDFHAPKMVTCPKCCGGYELPRWMAITMAAGVCCIFLASIIIPLCLIYA